MYESVDESAVQRPRIWPAILAFILVPPVGLVSFYFYKCAHDHIDSRRLGYIDPGFLSQGAVDRGRRFVVESREKFQIFSWSRKGFLYFGQSSYRNIFEFCWLLPTFIYSKLDYNLAFNHHQWNRKGINGPIDNGSALWTIRSG